MRERDGAMAAAGMSAAARSGPASARTGAAATRPAAAQDGRAADQPEAPADRPDAANQVALRVDGPAPFGGTLKGKGELRVRISDAARASLILDYSSADRLEIELRSRVGIELGASSDLQLSGGLTRDMLERELSGEIGLRLDIGRTASVRIEQEFESSGNTTALSVRVTL